MPYIVYIKSLEYGADRFDYDTFVEALEGLGRLAQDALNSYGDDGIVRTVTLDCAPVEEAE